MLSLSVIYQSMRPPQSLDLSLAVIMPPSPQIRHWTLKLMHRLYYCVDAMMLSARMSLMSFESAVIHFAPLVPLYKQTSSYEFNLLQEKR